MGVEQFDVGERELTDVVGLSALELGDIMEEKEACATAQNALKEGSLRMGEQEELLDGPPLNSSLVAQMNSNSLPSVNSLAAWNPTFMMQTTASMMEAFDDFLFGDVVLNQAMLEEVIHDDGQSNGKTYFVHGKQRERREFNTVPQYNGVAVDGRATEECSEAPITWETMGRGKEICARMIHALLLYALGEGSPPPPQGTDAMGGVQVFLGKGTSGAVRSSKVNTDGDSGGGPRAQVGRNHICGIE